MPIDIEGDVADPAGRSPTAGRSGGSTATAEAVPSGPLDLAAGSWSVNLGLHGTPTLQLTPLEVDAIAQGSLATDMAELEPDASRFRTVEGIRLALGSSSIPPATAQPTTAPPAENARGPRRARQTLRAEKIKPPPVMPDRPPRKR